LSDDETLVAARDLRRNYRMAAGTVQAVRGVSFDVKRGEYVAIVGPSGCGKSTLLNLLGAIDAPSSGSLTIAGQPLSGLSDRLATLFRLRNIGFVFQRFYLMPVLTALENVELPMSEAGLGKDERRQRARELLQYVGLGGRVTHRPTELSGGEQQRVAIARALVSQPTVVFADEPTGNLDSATSEDILRLMRESVDTFGQTTVMVTHDPRAAAIADRILFLADGLIVRELPRSDPADVLAVMNELNAR
jgi:putative ABC transport system ATP-binding protein